MKRTLQLLFGIVLAAGLLWLTFRGTSLGDLRDRLASLHLMHYVLLTAGMGMGVVHVLVRALRWRTLLAPVRRGIPFYPLFATTALGYAASLAGGRVGEILRPTLLGLREKVPVSAAVGTVVVERLLDLVALVVLGALALLVPPSLTGFQAAGDELVRIRTVGGLALAAGLGLLLFLALAASRRERIEAWAARRGGHGFWGKVAGKVLGLLGRFFQGADVLRSPRLLLSAGLQSLGVWVVIGIGVWLMLLGCGIPAGQVPFPGVFLLIPVLALGIALPTPGGTGGYHFAMRWSLVTFFGVDPATGVTAGLLHHAATWLPMIVLAGIVMAHEGLGVRALSRAAREAPGASPGGGTT